MSNIFFKGTVEKKWRTQNFDFLSLKSSLPGQFWECRNPRRYPWISKFLLQLKNQRCGAKLCVINSVKHIADQTNFYLVLCTGKSINVDEYEMEQYFGILLLMSVIKLPQVRTY